MTDSNRLVSMIALIIAGLIVAIWGIIFIWLNRNDRIVIAGLVNAGTLSAVDAARFTNPTWIWVLGGIQILLGIILIIWGIFQYVARPEDVVVFAKGGYAAVKGQGATVRNVSNAGLASGSRRMFIQETAV